MSQMHGVKHEKVLGLVWYSNGTVAMCWIGYNAKS